MVGYHNFQCKHVLNKRFYRKLELVWPFDNHKNFASAKLIWSVIDFSLPANYCARQSK